MAAALGILILLMFPESVTLVWLAVLSLPANSPLSPILPAAFEPLIMEAAKYERVVPVTLVALAGYMYTEYLNWHVYSWMLGWERLAGLRDRRSIRWGTDRFARRPITTIVAFALLPIPFWAIRSIAIMHGYPVRPFMMATLVGRLPRIFAYAWLGGLLHVPTLWLAGVIVVTTLVAVGLKFRRGGPLLDDPGTRVAGTMQPS